MLIFERRISKKAIIAQSRDGRKPGRRHCLDFKPGDIVKMLNPEFNNTGVTGIILNHGIFGNPESDVWLIQHGNMVSYFEEKFLRFA